MLYFQFTAYMLFLLITAYILYFIFTAYMLFYKRWRDMHYTINTIAQLKPILIGYRKTQGLSQQDMATKLGVKQQTYQRFESSPHKITVERLFKVLTILGVKLYLSNMDIYFNSQKATNQNKNHQEKEQW